jgi:XTP/dITP diphosphohydrolase
MGAIRLGRLPSFGFGWHVEVWLSLRYPAQPGSARVEHPELGLWLRLESMRIFVATSNAGKLKDFAVAAAAFPEVEILPLPGLERIAPPVEDAETFAGNAFIKALTYSATAPGELVVADDSGIAVRALGGGPGVRSARFAEDQGYTQGESLDARNLNCLLEQVPQMRYRDASYVCALAAVRDGALIATATGELQGSLIEVPRGSSGFGYDPIFEVLELAQTMAEVDAETRLRISHRGRALVALLKTLKVVLPDGPAHRAG